MSHQIAPLILHAPAKVNLTLQVGPVRPDGFHELDSLLIPVTLFDTLRFTPANTLELLHAPDSEIPPEALGAPEHNLILRAARLLQKETSTSFGATIHLTKRIPTGAGLGGGSSDCAATLHALNRLWNLNLPIPRLEALSANLGSDIPAFVRGGAQRMLGRGERLESPWNTPKNAPIPPLWLVLANCGTHCSTKEVYAHCTPALTSPPEVYYTVRSSTARGAVSELAPALVNDLQDGVFRRYPQVAQSARELEQAGALRVLLSGSGATVFGLARNRRHAEEMARRLPAGLWNRIVHTIARWCNSSTRDFDSLCPSSNLGRATTDSGSD